MDQMPYKEAEEFFEALYRGKHHFPNKIREFGPGWSIQHYGSLSTFDFDNLTRLVFLAHDKCVRVEIARGGPQGPKIIIHKRQGREGDIWFRHPTIETALENWRAKQEGISTSLPKDTFSIARLNKQKKLEK